MKEAEEGQDLVGRLARARQTRRDREREGERAHVLVPVVHAALDELERALERVLAVRVGRRRRVGRRVEPGCGATRLVRFFDS